jgi:hypothetical protein
MLNRVASVENKVTRNTALRLLAMLLMTILFSSLATDAELGIGGLFVGWGLSCLVNCSLYCSVAAVSAIRAVASYNERSARSPKRN